MLSVLLTLLLPAVAASKAPLTHEALWMMKRVSSPTVSPDGRWVVYTLSEPSYEEGASASDLWIVAADGRSKPRRLTTTRSAESSVSWSPDSQRILFAAKREGDESTQIYLLNVAIGGEAQRITNLSTGASGPQFSPDGKHFLFTSRVYPGAKDDAENKKAAAERKARKYKARVYESFPIRNWDRWRDDLQTHLFVQPFEPDAAPKPRDLLAATQLVANPGFSGASTSGGDDLRPIWTPDNSGIIITATLNLNQAAYRDIVTHLYLVPVAGGEPRPITSGDDGYSTAAFSPDGKALYAICDRNNGKVFNNTRLARLDWPLRGAPVLVSEPLDSSINSVAISADSKTIYVSAEHHGLEKLYALPATGGAPQPIGQASSGVYTGLQAPEKGAFLIGLWSSATNPAEVVRIDPAAKTHQLLTHVNTETAANLDWQPLRHFWFTAANGRKIHNMLALPPNFDESKKYPLFVLLHGGPHTMWRDEITLRWNYHLLAAGGYVVLLTNYTGSTGFGEAFAQAMKGDPLKGPAEEINQAADHAIRQFSFIDGSRQCAGGASYGGHLANWLEATTTRYRCLISHAGLINLESQWGTSDSIYHREVMAGGPVWEQGAVWREQNPIRFAANFKTPILVTVGENDFRVPLNQSLENWSALQRMRVPSKLIVFPDANHWILKPEDSRFFYSEVAAWLARYLKN